MQTDFVFLKWTLKYANRLFFFEIDLVNNQMDYVNAYSHLVSRR